MAEPLRVLLVEDSEDDTLLTVRELQRAGYDLRFERVETSEGLAAALESQTWDAIICDYNLPRFTGPEALKIIRESLPDLPCIVVSGTVGEETAVDTMKAGANDYVMKDKLLRLPEAIRRELSDAEVRRKRRQAEEELRKYRDHLEEMVEERTRELKEAQEELVRKEKLATLGQLAGGVGHELRNPLAVISNAVYFLQATLPEADETTRKYLDMIGSEVRGASKIISDLLDYSRTKPSEREEMAATELVARALDRYPPPEGVKVNTQIFPDLPSAFVDPGQIGQVLNNLISNAYQAMPEGGKLTISAGLAEGEPVGSRQSAVRISVSDTGTGISKENISKVFEPLFSTRTRGIGLGLAVSRNLVEANGGSIIVQSQEGKGSTFTLTLPAGEAET